MHGASFDEKDQILYQLYYNGCRDRSQLRAGRRFQTNFVSEKSQIFVFPARHFLFIIEMLQRRSKSEVMKS